MKKNILFIMLICMCVFTGCGYDNYDEPKATLSGNIMYNGQNVGLRTNGPRIDLYQDGYAYSSNISVYPAHDGTYSASLFEGEYKLVFRDGAPWDTSVDTMRITVKGHTKLDLEVKPYFIIKNETFQRSGNTIVAKFMVEQVDPTATIEAVRFYMGEGILTDNTVREVRVEAPAEDTVAGREITLVADITDEMLAKGYLFARLGVKTMNISEYYYSQVQKIAL